METKEQDSKVALQETTNRFSEALKKGNVTVLASIFSENVFFKFPGQEPLKGRDAVKNTLEELFKQGITGQLNTLKLDVSQSGEMAYEVGEYKLHAGGNIIDQGNYLTVYKLNGEKWEIFDDVISSSTAAG